MNSTLEWAKSASQFEPSAFRRFLRFRGWKEAQGQLGKSFIFTREVSNVGEVEVEIPSKKEFVDYKRRITEAIEIISLAESAKPHQIVQSISRPNVDILGFRYSGEELRDGTISLEDALRIRTARKQLLLSIAHSVVEPLSHFPRLSKAEPLDFLSSCRENPPKEGSYISEIIVPVQPSFREGADLEEPFSRRVMSLLAKALYEVQHSLEEGNDHSLLEKPELGLSSNFLSALSALNPPQGRGTLEVQFDWSSTRSLPHVPKSFLRFGEDLFHPLNEAARVLRDTTPVPDYQLEGFVVRLERAEGDQSGTIVLATTLEEQSGTSKVYMTLPPELYALALEAHKEDLSVRVTGTLVRRRRRLLLKNPGGFSIIQTSNS
ncbi:MAG TPA: hypothetical protein DCE42_22060 [Myxococcales bacterium]|nr:hypothetical protein [Deltaproteobacteria bacterium]HAA57466.1 hypothetical protein [Myxococcales bacterium]|tara:strand:+ start:1078 stop:2208 length:1131 start_codon:yes stop_codon:yes gene_type:complete